MVGSLLQGSTMDRRLTASVMVAAGYLEGLLAVTRDIREEQVCIKRLLLGSDRCPLRGYCLSEALWVCALYCTPAAPSCSSASTTMDGAGYQHSNIG